MIQILLAILTNTLCPCSENHRKNIIQIGKTHPFPAANSKTGYTETTATTKITALKSNKIKAEQGSAQEAYAAAGRNQRHRARSKK
jgi:ABC-type Fe2+-enterobactin transport system substrate-binding protein